MELIDCSILHLSIFLVSPLSRTSGTSQDLYSFGRVYTGNDNKLSWNESVNAEVSSPKTPGIKRMILSVKIAAGNSPPVNT